jgi:hypothetical protein
MNKIEEYRKLILDHKETKIEKNRFHSLFAVFKSENSQSYEYYNCELRKLKPRIAMAAIIVQDSTSRFSITFARLSVFSE